MKSHRNNVSTRRVRASIAAVAAAALGLTGCTTYESVESSAVTRALDFDEANRIDVEVVGAQRLDTAFSDDMKERATETLIDELEDEGFDYTGSRDPDLQVTLSTYVTTRAGVIDTSLAPDQRVVEREVTTSRNGITETTRTVTTSRDQAPIIMDGPGRVFVLEVHDSVSEALLWRGHLIDDDTGLDRESLANSIELLVEKLDEET